MISFIRLLQHPLIKIFLSPFAFIGIGTILGLSLTTQKQWASASLLLIITISSQLIDHYFHQKDIKRNKQASSEIILYLCEAITVIAIILFALINHWILILLLIMYIAFIHLQYMPYQLINTFYQYILSLFFYGFVLNSIAYYSQTLSITTAFLIRLIPMILLTAGVLIEITHLKYVTLTRRPQSSLYHWTGIVLSLVGISLGFYYTLPSMSYFIVQILYLIILGICLIPMIIKVNNEKKRQNKINYLSSILLVFSIFYSLAIIF